MKISIPVYHWLVDDWNWPSLALFAALFGFVIAPPLLPFLGLGWTLLFLQLPLYMLHQFEEHYRDRFRAYANAMFHQEVLSRSVTFAINSIGVWGVDLLAIYGACFLEPGLGLIAIYLTIVNGLLHLLPAIRQRRSNPGFYTATFCFLPLGIFSLKEFSDLTQSSWGYHIIGLLTSILIHGLIIAHVRRQLTSHPK